MKKIYYSLFILLALCATSCRPTGDDLVSYGQNDFIAFVESSLTYSGQFKSFWMAMNENYGMWDYEEANGLNWDEVYNTYLPRFEELDNRQTPVTDEEFEALYSEFLSQLHDGHIFLRIKNLHTGEFIGISPSDLRNKKERGERYKNEEDNITNLDFYYTLTADNPYGTLAYDAVNSRTVIAEVIDSTCSRLTREAEAYIKAVDNAGGPSEFNNGVYESMKKLIVDAKNINDNLAGSLESTRKLKELVQEYNDLCKTYSILAAQLQVAMPTIDTELAEDELKFVNFALFNGNVAYLRFGGFGLSTYLEAPAPSDTTSFLYAYHKAVHRVWGEWFGAIQVLHANGQLGGVLLDVRNNGGGAVADYPFVLGALLPSGGYNSHYMRVKEGVGRLDFAPITPFKMPTFPAEHAVIENEPIVILVNTHSVSMSEVTTWGVKSQPNGYVVGTRTWGGLSALNNDPSMYSTTYSGGFGEDKVTTFFGYVPRYVSLFGEDMQMLEGTGITPNLEVELDVNSWQTQKRDNQLEKALDYIHNH